MKQTKEDKKVEELIKEKDRFMLKYLQAMEFSDARLMEDHDTGFNKKIAEALQEAILSEQQRLLEGLEEMRREDGELNEAGECVCCGDGGGWMPCVNAEVNTCLDQVKELINKQQ